MIGAIIGDIVGSRFEFNNHRSTDFALFGRGCGYTDDTVLTVAIAKAIMDGIPFGQALQSYGHLFPSPKGAYGASFSRWLHMPNPTPYNSFGNGSAMRVSPCALLAKGNREKALTMAAASAMPTHNEGIKGAMAVVDAILMAFDHTDKETIRDTITSLYGYDLGFTCDDIRDTNQFNETCMVTVPQAIVAFLDSTSFEDAIRLAVSIGGDSDTIAAICGPIAEAYYGIPTTLRTKALKLLPDCLKEVVQRMYNFDVSAIEKPANWAVECPSFRI